eukprot:4305337-Pyramimonas_sp.AAC.2
MATMTMTKTMVLMMMMMVMVMVMVVVVTMVMRRTRTRTVVMRRRRTTTTTTTKRKAVTCDTFRLRSCRAHMDLVWSSLGCPELLRGSLGGTLRPSWAVLRPALLGRIRPSRGSSQAGLGPSGSTSGPA